MTRILSICAFPCPNTSAGKTSTPPASSTIRLTCASSAWQRSSCSVRAGCPYRTLFDELGLWLPRVHVECDFFHPVTLDELLIVDAYFGRIGTSSIHLNFEVRRSEARDLVVATGKYILVAVKRGEFKPTPVPDEVREKLARYVEESAIQSS